MDPDGQPEWGALLWDLHLYAGLPEAAHLCSSWVNVLTTPLLPPGWWFSSGPPGHSPPQEHSPCSSSPLQLLAIC